MIDKIFYLTYDLLSNCYFHIDDKNLSEKENEYREKLIQLCRKISEVKDL